MFGQKSLNLAVCDYITSPEGFGARQFVQRKLSVAVTTRARQFGVDARNIGCSDGEDGKRLRSGTSEQKTSLRLCEIRKSLTNGRESKIRGYICWRTR